MSIGNKTYFTIGEVSELTGVKPTVLRFWEQEFEELSPVKNKFGHRVYRDVDVGVVLTLKELLYDKRLTIEGAKLFLRDSEKKESHPKILKQKLLELLDILKKME